MLDKSSPINYTKGKIKVAACSLRDRLTQKEHSMSTANNPSREHPSTYFVQDRSNQEEITRLQIQDQMITAGMGGVLPEQTDPTRFQRILDVGCGTGDWLIETARTYPTVPVLVGVDVSSTLLAYAQAQSAKQQVANRVDFRVMDALRMLEFPASYFELVNQRLGMSYLRTWDWPKLLSEYQRITRPDGIIRITECSFPVSSSTALTRLSGQFIRALSQAGHLFTPDNPDGVINELPRLLQQLDLVDVQTRLHTLEHRAGTAEGQSFYEDVKSMSRTLLPFCRKWSQVPDDYDEIYQQALRDIPQPDFVATWNLLTVWGTKRGTNRAHPLGS